MVMWNLVGHGVKLAARGVMAFSRTEAGQKTGEISSKAFAAARKSSSAAIADYRASKAARQVRKASDEMRFTEGQAVKLRDGTVGTVVAYMRNCDIIEGSSDQALTSLVLIERQRFSSEEDRCVIVADSALYPL